jgi:hypothetical protein
VSWGELLDKITILELKRDRIGDAGALANVARELDLLRTIAASVSGHVAPLVERLRGVNAALWDVEDAIRQEEAADRFGVEFVALARAVYTRNDERAAIKRAINDALGSVLVEEKSYKGLARQESTGA